MGKITSIMSDFTGLPVGQSENKAALPSLQMHSVEVLDNVSQSKPPKFLLITNAFPSISKESDSLAGREEISKQS